MSLFRRMIFDAVDKTVREAIERRLPVILENALAKRFTTAPNVKLTEGGFGLALALALRKHWPDIQAEQAAQWLWEYIDVPYGAKGYSWTPAAAAEVARHYVEDFGERHD